MATTGVTDWNLVCDRQWMVGMASSFYMLGLLIGSFVVGYSSDRFNLTVIHINLRDKISFVDLGENQFCCAC